MNRQQASPVVRPLINVSERDRLAQLITLQPEEEGIKTLCAAINGYAVVFESVNEDKKLNARILVCQKTDNGYSIVKTDNVKSVTEISELPCSTDFVSEESIEGGPIFDFMSNLADDGPWDSFDVPINEREKYGGLSLTYKFGK